MAAITFDTLKFVQTLEDAGVDRQQASAFAVAVRDSHETAELATKADLREMEVRMDVKMEVLRSELRGDMKALELRMTIKLGSLFTVGIGLILAVLKL